jgi:hypothetical protein
MGKKSALIPDGYTEKGLIKAIEGVMDDDLRFEYRPMSYMQRLELWKGHIVNGMVQDTVKFERACVSAVARQHLRSWNIFDEDEKMVPVSAENVARLRQPVYDKLLGIIIRGEPSDIEMSPDEAEEHERILKEAEANGVSYGDAKEDHHLKN